jgi:hypothetical protein
MRVLKAGSRLKSNVCDTQVMIIKVPPGEHELACGGPEMIDMNAPASGELDPAKAEATLLGKRYVDATEALELLCIKGGAGTLCLDGVQLSVKQAKALPTSD